MKPGWTSALEREVDSADAELPVLHSFVLPGGSPSAVWLHLARTVCRRAEREVVALAAAEPLPEPVVVYLNRLSDWLFALARAANAQAGVADVKWLP